MLVAAAFPFRGLEVAAALRPQLSRTILFEVTGLSGPESGTVMFPAVDVCNYFKTKIILEWPRSWFSRSFNISVVAVGHRTRLLGCRPIE